jgi:nucleoside-diphosphate-sugar epimerase
MKQGQRMGKRILVTGATGFIGGHLVRYLVERDYEVVACARTAEEKQRLFPAGVTARNLDITNPDSFGDAFAGVDAVVHAAAMVGDWGPSEDFLRTDRDGTGHVLDAAQGAGVPEFLHVSSITVYGFRVEGVVPEETPIVTASPWPYMQAKADAERLVEQARATGYPVTIVRPANVYGPGSVSWTLRPARLIRNRLISLPKGFGPSNTVYVENVVALIEACLYDDRARGETFHIVDEGTMGFDVFFGQYAEALGRGRVPVLPRWLQDRFAVGLEMGARLTGLAPPVTRHVLDFLCFPGHYTNDRSRRLLGFDPPVPAEAGMQRTLAYLQDIGMARR